MAMINTFDQSKKKKKTQMINAFLTILDLLVQHTTDGNFASEKKVPCSFATWPCSFLLFVC
jgi:hypothetical protein